MFETSAQVVVAFDGSADAGRALAWGIDLARTRHARLHVVIASGDLGELSDWAEEWSVGLAEEWRHEAESHLRFCGLRDWSLEIRDGLPAEVLVEASKHAGVMVMGSHGHTALGGAVMGSVSQHVTRYAHCPVVAVRAVYADASTRVVVGVDGSDSSIGAVEFAFEYADWIGGSVTALHGWRKPRAEGSATDLAHEIAGAERLLAEAVAGMCEKYPDIPVTLEAIPVTPARALADASGAAKLVVVGSRGRGAFATLLLGSVSSAVLHKATCPVAVVR
jgi:nucleotide-binding universal stress UspA family protein